MAGKPSTSLSTQNTCRGRASGAAGWKPSTLGFPKATQTCWFWTSRAEARVVLLSRGVLSAYGGGACMAECITSMHEEPEAAAACPHGRGGVPAHLTSVCPSVCDQLSSRMCVFKGSGQPKQNHIGDQVMNIRAVHISRCCTPAQLPLLPQCGGDPDIERLEFTSLL